MSMTAWCISYKIAKGAYVQDYLVASEQVNNEILSKQKGFVSWKVFADGDTWVDLVTWESEEDAKRAESAGATNPIALKYYSLIDMDSCQQVYYTVERSY